MERTIDNQCFMTGWLDQPSKKLPKGVVTEMENMVGFFAKAIEPSPSPRNPSHL